VAHVSLGQVRLLLDREPLDPALEARLTPEERRGLDALRRALAAAEELGLARSGSYRTLVDRGAAPLVTVVVAAPPDRVEPVTWWFPIVGSVPYRGYFEPERAATFARSLAGDGLDTYVRPALLYSTLGWFDDPVPRSLLALEPLLVFETIVHERVHETVFVADDISYNEGLASFVAYEAALRTYAGTPDAERARVLFADERRFGALLDRLAAELEALYAQTSTPEQARAEREPVFARWRDEAVAAGGFETDRFAGLARVPLSNAFVVAQRTYLGDLPCFERELAAVAGDLSAFIAAHVEAPGRRDDCPGRPD
jgi:predicted aminopeptidase